MKPLSIWLPLILIVSALLLSVVKSGLEPSPRPIQQPSENAGFSQQNAGQHPTPIPVANPSHSPDGTGESSSEEKQSSDTSTIVIAVSAAISAIAAGFIAWFNWQLVGVTDEMKKATKAAAQATEAALHLHRPAIVVISVKPQVGSSVPTGAEGTLISFWPEVYNLGSGPAEIIALFAHSRVFDSIDRERMLVAEDPFATDLIWDFPTNRIDFPRTILAPGETVSNYVVGFVHVIWIAQDIEPVKIGAKRRAVYGLIKYRSSVREYLDSVFLLVGPAESHFSPG